MLSRQLQWNHVLKPTLSVLKLESNAHLHIGNKQHLHFISLASKELKNHRGSVFNTGLQLRHESTSSPITQQTIAESSTGLEPIPDPPLTLSELTQPVVENFANEPTFSSLGLGGWTPVGIVQNCLEYLHVDCGLPWWGAVVLGTTVVRLMLFPIVVISQRNAAKLNNNIPQMQHLQAKITEAKHRGDKLDAARLSTEMMMFMNEKKINPLKNMIAPLCQAPIFISVFMGLRSMTSLPVESLKTGGALWFVDLTVPDQFYLLPIITSATLFCTIKVGADSGQPTQNFILFKYLMMGLPIILVPFTINFPGLMLVYWTSTNFISLAQVGFLRIPKVREYFNIDKLVKHDTGDLAIKDKGFVNNVKEAWNNMKIQSELEQRERADRMAFLRAGRDPIVKTYKYDPTKVGQSSTAAIQAKKK